MSNLICCDRCGVTDVPAGFDAAPPNCWHTITEDVVITMVRNHWDLCPKCYKSFEEFMNDGSWEAGAQ